jgi:epidermal growth factor receptor substrate 15
VQNTIAPPKQKQPKAVNAKALDVDSPKFVASPKSDDKSEKPQTTNEQGVGNGSVYNKSDDGSAKSAPNSPFASSTIGSPHRDFVDSDIRKTSGEDSSPRNQDDAQETQRYGF